MRGLSVLCFSLFVLSFVFFPGEILGQDTDPSEDVQRIRERLENAESQEERDRILEEEQERIRESSEPGANEGSTDENQKPADDTSRSGIFACPTCGFTADVSGECPTCKIPLVGKESGNEETATDAGLEKEEGGSPTDTGTNAPMEPTEATGTEPREI